MTQATPMARLVPEETAIVVVDVQERLARVMPEPRVQAVLRSARILLQGAKLLGAKALITEQYPQGLGPTVEGVLEAAEGALRLEKRCFSAWDLEAFQTALGAPRAVIVLGMETHVCVFQTVRDLVNAGYAVHVPVDGVSSRQDDHREAGLRSCERAGALLTTSETVAFDWLRYAEGDAFKALSRAIR